MGVLGASHRLVASVPGCESAVTPKLKGEVGQVRRLCVCPVVRALCHPGCHPGTCMVNIADLCPQFLAQFQSFEIPQVKGVSVGC